MANGKNIQGITIRLDGDAKPLTDSLKDVNKRTKEVSTELKDVERLLRFNPGNTEVIAQKQQLLAQQVSNTTEALNTLKSAESEVQAQFERGDIGEQQYRGFRREIVRAESQLAGFQEQLQQTGSTPEIDQIAEDMKAVSQRSKELVTDLRDIDKALKLDPGNMELVAQKQRTLGEQADMASQKLQGLRDAQADVEEQFSRGDMGQAEYDRFRRDIITTENSLQGLNAEILELGRDTSLDNVETTLQAVARRSKELVSELKEIDSALKLDPGNTELIAQKQRALGEQAQIAAQKLQDLKDAQIDVEAQFARGDMGRAEYDAFRRSVIQAEQQVSSLSEEIGSLGNTGTKLDQLKADLSGVTKESKDLVTELKDVEKMLDMDPGNVDLIAQKQQILKKQVQNTTTSLNSLRAAQSQVEQQFNNNEISGEQYRAFRREILQTETQLGSFQDQLRQMDEPVDFSQIERQAESLREELRQVEDALQMDPGNTELIEQRIRNLGQQAQVAETHLQGLKNKQQQVEAAFSNGTMGQAEYDRFRRSLIQAEQQVQALGDSLTQAQSRFTQFRNSVDQAAGSVGELGSTLGGLAAGVGIGTAISKALDMSTLDTSIDLSFNVPDESKGAIKSAIKDVTTYGVEAEEALEGARRQWALNADATDEANGKTLAFAATMARTYSQIDFTELIQETNEIAGELEITNDEALALANTLLKTGFPPEQIDTIAEYGGQLKRAGFEAEQIQGIMTRAAQSGSWNVDNLLDGLKEGRIKAVEMGNGLSDSFAAAIRGVTSDTKAASKETLEQMKEAASAQEEALSASNEKREAALESSLDNQLGTAEENYEKQTEAFTKSLDEQLSVAEKKSDAQQRQMDKAHDEELKSFEKMSNSKIELIDREYTERLKLVDEERYNALKKIDDEIAGIEGVMDADAKRAEEADNNAKRNELLRSVAEAKSADERAKAEQDLAKFEDDLRRKAVTEQRKAAIDSLRQEKDGVKEVFDERIDKIKQEQDAAKERATATIEADREAINTRQAMEKESFNERKEASLNSIREQNAEDLKAYQDLGKQKLDALRAQNKERLDEMKKAAQAEQDALKAANESEIKKAETPEDTAETKAMIKQLEDWGQAVAAGGESGAEALVNMTKWLDGLQNDSLKNLIGVEMFGTIWEDQGENLIETLTGIDEAVVTTADSMSGLQGSMDVMDSDPVAQLAEAMNELMTALGPILEDIANIISKVAEWIAENPELAATIMAVATAVGVIAGGLAALAPVISTVMTVAGALGPVIAALSGPIGIAVLAIAGLVAAGVAIYKNWDEISAKAGEIFTYIGDFIKESMDSLIETFTAVMDWLSEYFDFSAISDAISAAMTAGSEIVSATMEYLKETFSLGLQIIKDLFTGNFEGAFEGMKTHLDNIKDYVTTIIDAIKEFLSNIDLGEIGSNIMEGFMNGIKGTKDSVMDTMKSLVGDGVVGKAISILDTRSPSKVFEKLGVFSGEGLENGLKAMGARVAKASEQMTAGTIADPGGVQLAGVGGDVPVVTEVPPEQERQIVIQNMTVRSEDDIRLIAQELYRLQQRDKKGR